MSEIYGRCELCGDRTGHFYEPVYRVHRGTHGPLCVECSENVYQEQCEKLEAELQVARKVVEAARVCDSPLESLCLEFQAREDWEVLHALRAALAEYDSIAKGGEGK